MAAPSTRDRQLRLLVIGGIGSGKSTVLAMFGSLGAVTISSDRIGHEVLEPDGPAHPDVARRWPGIVREGRIDRGALAAIVFGDVDQLHELEAMTHPHIVSEITERAAAACPRPVAVELPLLLPLFDGTWVRVVVDADDDVRLERTVARGSPPTDAAARMAAQPPRERWLDAADHVILNDGSLAGLRARVEEVWREELRRHRE